MTDIELQIALAGALWRGYEESLPDTPWRMAKVIVAIFKKEGHIANNRIQLPEVR